jgi:hypothetical protein
MIIIKNAFLRLCLISIIEVPKNNKKHVERLRKEYNTSLINGEETRQHKYYIEHIEERKAYRKKYYEEVEAPKRKALSL